MTDSELDQLRQAYDELQAENAELKADLGLPRRSSAEWAQQARDIETDLDEYPDERVGIWCDAAEAWSQAGEWDEAERCYRNAAAEEPESGFPDPRAYYASFLIDHDRGTDRAHELLTEIWRARPTEPITYHFVAETIEATGDHHSALTWCNAGISRCYPQLFSPDVELVTQDRQLDMLLSTRRRLRRTLEQPEDTLDEVSEQARRDFGEALERFEQRHPVTRPSAVLYWPEAEFEQVPRQWPESHGGADEPHTEHRRAVEGTLRGAAEGVTPLVAHGDVAEFVEFCRQRDQDPALGSSRDDYASWLAEHERAIGWPPERNEPCWCASGRKYKKCCGAPGFVGSETSTGPR